MQGFAFGRLPSHLQEPPTQVWTQLGQLMAADLLCSNWDRVPLGLENPATHPASKTATFGMWQQLVQAVPGGNPHNIMISLGGEVSLNHETTVRGLGFAPCIY